jgi:predicted RNA-binding Zn ribbon-like protein
MATLLEFEERSQRAERLPLIGGALCLNFTNTVSGMHEGEHELEHLRTYANLIAWAAHADLVTPDEAQALQERAEEDGPGATRVLHRGLALRDIIHDIFAAVAHRRMLPERALDGLNVALSEAMRHARIGETDAGFAWGWDGLGARLDAPLWPIVRSAGELLTSGKLERVKQCPYPHCGWLFVDLSKNRSRRWCEMSVCGNRTKARRHYIREKQAVA